MEKHSPPNQQAEIPPQERSRLIALFNAGRYAELENLAHRLAEKNPNSGFIQKVLGAALQAQGKDALRTLRKAAALRPNDAETHNALGAALRDAGKLDDAAASYRKALEINPDYPEAFNNLGIVLHDLNLFNDAIDCLRQSLLIRSDYPQAHNNLGNSFHSLKRYQEAIESYEQALALQPDYPEAHNNLGNSLQGLGRFPEAIASYLHALTLRPNYPDAHNNLGGALRDLGRIDEAIKSYDQALSLKPDYVEALCNRGDALQETGRISDAIGDYRSALGIRPDYAEAHHKLGTALHKQGDLDAAIESTRRAIETNPDSPNSHSNLLYMQQYRVDWSGSTALAEAESYARQFEYPLKQHWPRHSNEPNPEKRLKIGYVSGDFQTHAVAYFFEPILSNHDKTRLEVFCYSNSRKHDDVTDRLMERADHWLSCADMEDEELAQRILADGVDILVDLSGHTAQGRLQTFARKPAPIQMTYLGYPGSSGLSAMDYRLTDNCTEPEGAGADAYYTEKLLRLPDSMWCYRPADDMPEISPLPALTNGYLTFGSFNNFNKLGSDCIALWAKLLLSVPGSRLVMATVPEGSIRELLIAQFTQHGIHAEHIAFYGKLSPPKFRKSLQEVDIALDPFPVNGATTTCESLWLGVPVLSMIGKRFLSRAGLSILSAAGMADFAVATEEDFIKTAMLLAENLNLLADIRAGLREHLRRTPLSDPRRFTRNLENIYRHTWAQWCNRIARQEAATIG